VLDDRPVFGDGPVYPIEEVVFSGSARQHQAKECSSRACCHLPRLQKRLRTERSAPRFPQALRSHHSHHAFLILRTHFSMSNLGTRGRWGDKAVLLQLVESMWVVKWWGFVRREGERERERECVCAPRGAPLGNGLESVLWFPLHPFVDWLLTYLMVLLDEKEITPSRQHRMYACMHVCMYCCCTPWPSFTLFRLLVFRCDRLQVCASTGHFFSFYFLKVLVLLLSILLLHWQVAGLIRHKIWGPRSLSFLGVLSGAWLGVGAGIL